MVQITFTGMAVNSVCNHVLLIVTAKSTSIDSALEAIWDYVEQTCELQSLELTSDYSIITSYLN